MSNFFGSTEVKTSFDLGGGKFPPIPEGTKVKAVIDEAKWDTYQDESFVSLRWSVLAGEFINRKIYQKIKIDDNDPAKSARAMEMLVAIDANAGGGIYSAGVKPDDMSLAVNLLNKSMVIRLAVWEINGKDGNWINAVESGAPNGQLPPQAPKKADAFDPTADIPF